MKKGRNRHSWLGKWLFGKNPTWEKPLAGYCILTSTSSCICYILIKRSLQKDYERNPFCGQNSIWGSYRDWLLIMGTCGRYQIVGFVTKSSHSKNCFACSRYYRAQHNDKDDGNEKITTERKTHSVFGTGFFACLPRPSTTNVVRLDWNRNAIAATSISSEMSIQRISCSFFFLS